MSRNRFLWMVIPFLLLSCLPALAGLSPQEVLVVVNNQSSISRAIGDYYQLSHGIPEVNMLRLTNCPTDETLKDPRIWYDQIWQPLESYLNNSSRPWMKERIKAIVLVKGIPVRFWAGDGRNASVDSPLCYLGSDNTAGYTPTGIFGPANLYCGRDEAFESFKNSDQHKQCTFAFPELYDISGTDSGVLLASGDSGVIVRSTDGLDWTALNDSQRFFASSPMVAIATSGNTGWIAQQNGRIHKSTTNSSCLTWGIYRDDNSTALYSISFADTGSGWASGAKGSSPVLIHSTGNGWSNIDLSSLNLPSSCTLNGVSVVGTDGVVACGTSGTVIKGRLVKGTWNFTKASGIQNTTYNSIALTPSGGSYIGWVVGDGGVILKTTDAGTTWQKQTSGTTRPLRKVFALDATHAWAATGSNVLLRTTDGSTWQSVMLPRNVNIKSVYFRYMPDKTIEGFAISWNKILRSIDGGTTWNEVFAGQNGNWRMNYMVCRLDGYQTPADANGLPLDIKRMIDDACKPDSAGIFIIDDTNSGNNKELADARDYLLTMKKNGATGIEDVKYNATDLFLTDGQRVIGYAGWGSNENTSPAYTQYAKPRNSWQRGSISTTYVSSSGRTFNYPADYANPVAQLSSSQAPEGYLQVSGCWQGWSGVLHDDDTGKEFTAKSNICGFLDFHISEKITNGYLKILYPDGTEVTSARITAPKFPLEPRKKYNIGYQSLVADLIHEGCDASIGNVWEPWLNNCGQPQYLLPRYASGYTWAEAAYMSLPHGGWQENAVGDPLMAAYATPPSIKITVPAADGCAATGAIKVSANAAPSGGAAGISRIEVWLTSGTRTDGKGTPVNELIYSAEKTKSVSCSFNSAKYPDGIYSIKVIAYDDSARRCCGVRSRHIYIQNSGIPAAKVTITCSSSTVRGKATVKAGVSNTKAVNSVEFWMLTPTGSRLIGTSTVAGGLAASFDSNYFVDGDCTVQAIARCANGKISASAAKTISIKNRQSK